MADPEGDVAAWARANAACFDLVPLVEMKEGKKIQVGITLELYARLPMDKPPGPERRAAAAEVLGKLRQIVESLRPESGEVRVQVEPPRTAAYLRRETEMEPEVRLSAQIYHAHDYFAPVTEDERARISTLERRLTTLGLKRGHW